MQDDDRPSAAQAAHEASDPDSPTVAGVEKPSDPADTKDFSDKLAAVHEEPKSDRATFEDQAAPYKRAEDLPDVGQYDERSSADHAIADGASSAYAQREKPDAPPLLPEN